MPVDAVVKVLTVLFLGALAVFLLRLFLLRIQDRYPLFVISNGLDMVFGVMVVLPGLESRSLMNVDFLALVIGSCLTPFVAFELYRAKPADDPKSLRFLAPVIAAILAGCIVTAFLASGPDDESLKDAYSIAFIFDTVVTFGVLGFLVGKLRTRVAPAGRNLIWMRGLFVFEVASSSLMTMFEASMPAQSGGALRVIYVGLSFLVMAVCALALRKQPQVTPALEP
jgi:hypothetical protein